MFASAQIHRQGGENYAVSHGEDKELYVEFSLEPVEQKAQSLAEGRKVYKDVPHITIHFPGDRTKKIFRQVAMTPEEAGGSPPDPIRFPMQWQAFQAQGAQAQEGMPLEHWPLLNKSQVLELKSQHIATVEQLASIPDTALQGIGLGGRELRAHAQAWIKQAKEGREVAHLTDELSKRDEQIALLQQQVQDIAAKLTKDKK